MDSTPDTCVSGRREQARALTRPLIAACFAGLLFSLAAPPFEWSWLAWLVPGLLLVPAAASRPLYAYLCGTAYAVVIGSVITGWAPQAAAQYFDSNWAAARAFIFGVHVINPGIPCGLMLVAYTILRPRCSVAARAPMGAVLWVASEWLRTWSLGWELLGHTQYRNLALIQIADVGGVYAVSFLMAMSSIAVAEMIAIHRVWISGRALRAHLLWPAVAVLVVALYGQQSLRSDSASAATEDDGERRIAIVQGNVPNQYRWNRAFFGRTLATYAQLTDAAIGQQPDLVVWPENAVNFYINRDRLLHAQMKGVAAGAREGLLVGAPRRGGGREAYNSIYLLGTDGEIRDTYDKQLLVPFGEYNPFPIFGRVPGADDVIYTAGEAASPMQTGSLRLAAMICYEVLFPALVRHQVLQGAEVLFNLSNDSWMDAGDGAASMQHFSMAVFRAVETRRHLVRASSGGASGFVDPTGRMYGVLPAGVADISVGRVVRRHELTPYVRFGDAWIAIALLAVILLAFGRQPQQLAAYRRVPRRLALAPRS